MVRQLGKIVTAVKGAEMAAGVDGGVLCLKPSIKLIQRIWKGGITVTGRWCCPVVCDGLDALPHVPCVSALSEMAVDVPVVCTLYLSDSLGQFGPCCS